MSFNAWLRMAADFENQLGEVHLKRELTPDSVKAQSIADIDLKKLAGKGHLTPVQIEFESNSLLTVATVG